MHRRDTVTMKKVAEQAGVSTMAVSLALRGDGSSSRLSEETRQRILEAARVLDYHPNARGRALRSGYTNVIGLYAGYGYVNVRLPFFTEIVSGLQEGCEQFKKDLLLHGAFHGGTSEAIFTELVDGRIDGLVVNMPPDDPMAERLARSHLPVVAVADPLPDIPSIVADDAGSRSLVQHLVERGYQHFVYLSSALRLISASRRHDAFVAAAAEAGREIEEMPWSDQPGGAVAFEAWLDSSVWRRQRTAVVCWNDQTAYDILAECQRRGIHVPDEIGIVGFDGCHTPYEGVWSLTTVRAPWSEVARTAVQYLEALLEGKAVPPQTVLPVELIPGHTT